MVDQHGLAANNEFILLVATIFGLLDLEHMAFCWFLVSILLVNLFIKLTSFFLSVSSFLEELTIPIKEHIIC